jgi:TRAP-type C4-dicarboxylate transport system permease small subunit
MSSGRKGIARKIWDNLERSIMVILMVVFLLNITAQVFSRMIFNKPLSYTEEISRYSFLWMVMLGFSFATKYDRHIKIDLLTVKFSPLIKKVVDLFINILALLVFIWVFYVGIVYMKYTSISTTPALQISRAYIVIIVPLSAFLMILRSVEKVILIIKSKPSAPEGGKKP